jgi:hypothetical protein
MAYRIDDFVIVISRNSERPPALVTDPFLSERLSEMVCNSRESEMDCKSPTFERTTLMAARSLVRYHHEPSETRQYQRWISLVNCDNRQARLYAKGGSI